MGSKARKKKRLSNATHQVKGHNDFANMIVSNGGHDDDDGGSITSRHMVQCSVSVK